MMELPKNTRYFKDICQCMTLKTGCLVLGYFSLMESLLLLVALIKFSIDAGAVVFLVFGGTVMTIILFDILFIYGVYKEILLYIQIEIGMRIFFCFLLLCTAIEVIFVKQNPIELLGIFFNFVTEIYFILIIWSYAMEVKDRKNDPKDETTDVEMANRSTHTFEADTVPFAMDEQKCSFALSCDTDPPMYTETSTPSYPALHQTSTSNYPAPPPPYSVVSPDVVQVRMPMPVQSGYYVQSDTMDTHNIRGTQSMMGTQNTMGSQDMMGTQNEMGSQNSSKAK